MKVSENFWLQEFVPPDVYQMAGKNALWFLDPKIIILAQFVRDRFGKPVTINDWMDGGDYKFSGFRDPLCTEGVLFSQHRFGRAIDAKVRDVDPEEVRADIKTKEFWWMEKGLTAYEENTLTWNHLDCRNTGLATLKIIYP